MMPCVVSRQVGTRSSSQSLQNLSIPWMVSSRMLPVASGDLHYPGITAPGKRNTPKRERIIKNKKKKEKRKKKKKKLAPLSILQNHAVLGCSLNCQSPHVTLSIDNWLAITSCLIENNFPRFSLVQKSLILVLHAKLFVLVRRRLHTYI